MNPKVDEVDDPGAIFRCRYCNQLITVPHADHYRTGSPDECTGEWVRYRRVKVSEKPILFSGPMVRAIIEDRKTQTRRIIKRRDGALPLDFHDGMFWFADGDAHAIDCPYGKVGYRLWVRETFARTEPHPCIGEAYAMPLGAPTTEIHKEYWKRRITFKADYPENQDVPQWKPSIHMPRWASRLTLEITAVRGRRLNEITEEDAKAEGVNGPFGELFTPRRRFEDLWDSINSKRAPWASNPWVWAITFEVVKNGN